MYNVVSCSIILSAVHVTMHQNSIIQTVYTRSMHTKLHAQDKTNVRVNSPLHKVLSNQFMLSAVMYVCQCTWEVAMSQSTLAMLCSANFSHPL